MYIEKIGERKILLILMIANQTSEPTNLLGKA